MKLNKIKWFFITYFIFYHMIQYCITLYMRWYCITYIMYRMIWFLNIQYDSFIYCVSYDCIMIQYIQHCIISHDTKSYETLLYSVVHSDYLSLYKQINNNCNISWSKKYWLVNISFNIDMIEQISKAYSLFLPDVNKFFRLENMVTS